MHGTTVKKYSDEVSSFTSAILNLIGALYKHWYQINYIRITACVGL